MLIETSVIVVDGLLISSIPAGKEWSRLPDFLPSELNEWRFGPDYCHCMNVGEHPYADQVIIAPSNVPHSGMGLYTKVARLAGQVVCHYTGWCMKCVTGNKSKYIATARQYNAETGKYDTWYLDANDKRYGVYRERKECKISKQMFRSFL